MVQTMPGKTGQYLLRPLSRGRETSMTTSVARHRAKWGRRLSRPRVANGSTALEAAALPLSYVPGFLYAIFGSISFHNRVHSVLFTAIPAVDAANSQSGNRRIFGRPSFAALWTLDQHDLVRSFGFLTQRYHHFSGRTLEIVRQPVFIVGFLYPTLLLQRREYLSR